MIKIGNLEIGSKHPIRVQSMTNTLTEDSNATADQITTITNIIIHIRATKGSMII